jgi:hypothetical protein
MTNELAKTNDPQNEIVLYQPDQSLKLEVRLEDETVWLSQAQMAELFGRERTVIGKHIRGIFDEGELDEKVVCANFAHTTPHGAMKGGTQTAIVVVYNLDVIISVGYRVRSRQGTLFRQWANRVLKDYLLRGHAINQRFERVEHRVTEAERKIDFFVRTAQPPAQGVFYEGQIFDAYVFAADLVKSAKRSLVLLDNHVDESVLLLLTKRSAGVRAKIVTRKIPRQFQLDAAKHNAQYEPVVLSQSNKFHDRFLLVDDTVYHIGASLKDLGKKLFAFSKLEAKPADILKGI